MNTRIERELKRMEVGMCGVKWDCVVWRVGVNRWVVGKDTVDRNRAAYTLHEAVEYIAY